ncbi:MAG: hypothetical protein K9M82_02735 [Deltaproteobacteria bacterium]|nr:hypothetical protein [Deltaproteobacteria bacterium]
MNPADETAEERPIDTTEGESGAEPEGSKEPREAIGSLRALLARLGSYRTAVLAGLAAVLILAFAGMTARLLMPSEKPARPGRSSDPVFASDGIADTPDRLVKQELAPFYIPLPHGESGRMVRLSFVVTWDRSCSSRFRGQERRVRDRLYLRMTELAAEGGNMRSMSLTIRTEARKILEELLRPEEIHVVVTGIFIV